MSMSPDMIGPVKEMLRDTSWCYSINLCSYNMIIYMIITYYKQLLVVGAIEMRKKGRSFIEDIDVGAFVGS